MENLIIKKIYLFLSLIIITSEQIYDTFLNQAEYQYVDCPTSLWDVGNVGYDCFLKCHWDISDSTLTNDYGLLWWDETQPQAIRDLVDIPNAEPAPPIIVPIGAFNLKITVGLLKITDSLSGNPFEQWAAGDNIDLSIEGISAMVDNMNTYDKTVTCYDDVTGWGLNSTPTGLAADTLQVAYQKDIVFTFDMSQLPILTRNTLRVMMTPTLTNAGTYYGLASFKVEYLPCDLSCLDCNGDLPTNCQSCPTGNVLQGNKCQPDPCNAYFYSDVQRICQPCLELNCITCDPSDPTICFACDVGYLVQLDGTCATTPCPSGNYDNASVCTPCDGSCEECQGGTANDCISCTGAQYVVLPAPGPCVPCSTGCLTCDTVNQCTSCDDGWYLEGMYCVNTCQANAGTWPNSGTNECEQCNIGCVNCLDPSLVYCTACHNNHFMNSSNVCTPDCPEGFYENTTTWLCVACVSCVDCENSITDCTKCESDEYLTGTAPTRSCNACHPNCAKCYNSGNTACTQCNPGFWLQYNTDICLTTCPDGFYQNIDDQSCTQCDDACTRCTGPYTTGCTPGYCKTLESWYHDGTECTKCDFKCEQCTGGLDTQCQVCNEGYVRDIQDTNTNCRRTCIPGQWPDFTLRECHLCVSPCVECDGGAQTNCTKCVDGDYLINGSCLGCTNNCLTCETSPSFCTSCGIGKYLFQNECIDDCGDYYYADNTLRICTRCHDTCRNCNGTSNNNCVECDGPRFLDDNHCRVCTDFQGRFADQNVFPQSKDDCLEFCGDGIRDTGYIECDDGNSQNGDGCSDECIIEPEYQCTRRDVASRDVCYPLKATFTINLENDVSIFPNNDKNSNINVVVNFNRELVIPEGKTIKDYIVISIEGLPSLEYTVIKDVQNPEIIVLSTTIPQTIIGKQLSVSFVTDQEFVTVITNQEDGSTEAQLTIEYYTFYDEAERSHSSFYAFVVKLLIFAQMCFFIVLVFTNYFPQVQLTLDVLQLLYVFRWNGIKYPLNGHETFLQLDPVFKWYLPQVLSYLLNEYTEQETYTSYFNYGIDALFWKNADQVIFASLCGFGIYLIIKIFCNETLWKIKNPRSRKAQRFFMHYMTIFFEYNFFINITQSAAIPISFYAALQLTQVTSSGVVVASMILLVFCSFWILGSLGFWMITSAKNRKELIYDDHSRDLVLRLNNRLFKHRIVWDYLDVFNTSSYIQPIFMYFRKVMFPIVVVASHNSVSDVQLPVLLTLNAIYFIFLGLKNPIRNKKKENWKLMIQELMHLLCFIPLFLLADDTNEDTAQRFKWFNLFTYFLIVLISTNIFYLSMIFIIQPLIVKLWSATPQTHNVYTTTGMEQVSRKEQQNKELGVQDILSSDGDSEGYNEEDRDKGDTKTTFNVSKRKILRNQHKTNIVNTKNSRKNKAMPTTLVTEQTRVNARNPK